MIEQKQLENKAKLVEQDCSNESELIELNELTEKGCYRKSKKRKLSSKYFLISFCKYRMIRCSIIISVCARPGST